MEATENTINEQDTESPFTLQKRLSVEEVTCFSLCVFFVLFSNLPHMYLHYADPTYASLPAKNVFSCACITLQRQA